MCCGRFFHDSGEPHLCQQCLQKKPSFSCHRSSGLYSERLKDVIILYKYQNFRILGKHLAQFICLSLRKEDEIWNGTEALIPVPLHPKRKRQRGFNQAQIIAKELALLKDLELLDRELVKIKNVLPQTTLEAKDRLKNVIGAFKVRRGKKVNEKVVLLVDDVYTTGATIQECSSVLIEAGAKEVRAVTIAQA